MLVFEVWRALDGHPSTDVCRGLFDLTSRESKAIAQEGEAPVVELLVGESKLLLAEILAEHELIKDERQLERTRQRHFYARKRFLIEALRLQGRPIDVRRFCQRTGSLRVSLDRADLFVRVAELMQRGINRLIDDLEIAAAGELLEFYQREVGLDAGRITVHHEPYGAGRSGYGDLSVTISSDFADGECFVPHLSSERPSLLRKERRRVRYRLNAEAFIFARIDGVGRASMISNNAQHRIAIGVEACECTEILRELGRRTIRHAGKQRVDRTAPAKALFRVIRKTHAHQQRSEIGVAKT